MSFDRNHPAKGVDGVPSSHPTESPDLFQLALKSAGLGLFDFAPATDRLSCDARFREILGVPRDVLLDRRSLSQCVHADHRDRLNALADQLSDGSGSAAFREEFRGAAPRGATDRWVAVSGEVSFDAKHRPQRVVGVVQDVTDRKLSEQQAVSQPASVALFPEVTARLFGATELQDRKPREYSGFLEKYSRLLELTLERHTFKVTSELSTELREIAERLGAMRAGAREVADLHSKALSGISKGAGRLKAQALVSEGRMLSFELMGYLLSFYRRRAGFDSRQAGGDADGDHG